MKILDTLRKLQKLMEALVTLVPTIIELVQDFADDGKRNYSNNKASNKPIK